MTDLANAKPGRHVRTSKSGASDPQGAHGRAGARARAGQAASSGGPRTTRPGSRGSTGTSR
eukprot:11188377-Alexandrium_andersonii.AAC.1